MKNQLLVSHPPPTIFKPGAPGFLKLLLSVTLICVCVSALKAINYIHMILNMYNQLNKFVMFINVMKATLYIQGEQMLLLLNINREIRVKIYDTSKDNFENHVDAHYASPLFHFLKKISIVYSSL